MVSVAMAVYNGEKYLIEQLDSIKNQTIKVDEVIICDDKSSDNSVDIINKYIINNKLSDYWKLFINDNNLGYADNFYKAMSLTSGEYIFLSDQDDIWMKDRIERMVGVMEDNQQIMLLGSDFTPYYCTEDAPKISKKAMRKMLYNDSIEHVNLNHNTIFIGSEGCTMCVRSSFFDKIKEYWYPGWAHDEYLWKLALCHNGCYIYHKSTLKRRLHSNNVSKKKMHEIEKRVSFLNDLYSSHKRTLDCALDQKLEDKYIRLIERNIQSVDLRVKLLRDKKLINSFKLALFYFNNYHSIRSIPVELFMAIRG